MGKLTGTVHGDAANDLLAFYEERVAILEEAGQYFMAAMALGLALETSILTYLLVEFGEDNGGELEIPDSVSLFGRSGTDGTFSPRVCVAGIVYPVLHRASNMPRGKTAYSGDADHDSDSMAITIPSDADPRRSEATLGCSYHAEVIGIRDRKSRVR